MNELNQVKPHPSSDFERWNKLTATEQHKQDFNWRLDHQFKMKPCKLQAKWRGIDTYKLDEKGEAVRPYEVVTDGQNVFPETFPSQEVEFAILDAFINEGGATAWTGDGSSCAVQIVQNIWRLAKKELDAKDVEIAYLKKLLRSYDKI